MKKIIVLALCLFLMGIGSSGCSQLTDEAKSNISEKVSATVSELYSSKVESLGDNSAVSKLIGEVGLGNITNYTIELQTGQEPYGLIINVAEQDDSFTESDFSLTAVQLLGLISNLDYVEVNNGDQHYKMTTDEATALIDENVKNLSDSADKLESVLNQLTGN
ncbi:DUF4825 domain-containing protein [Eubacteriaceae bacterium ES2]|nr:DUF4825 domain-containing protein [Eubacteriaceae bacterium ES2]